MAVREMRFWRNVEVAGSEDCWTWQGKLNHKGYGAYSSTLAHRVAYELVVGPIPAALQIDHLCRNRACVNPGHLEAVSSAVNTYRGVGVAAINRDKSFCDHGHEFTAANTYVQTRVRNGRVGTRRTCRACGVETTRRYKARRAA